MRLGGIRRGVHAGQQARCFLLHHFQQIQRAAVAAEDVRQHCDVHQLARRQGRHELVDLSLDVGDQAGGRFDVGANVRRRRA